MMHSVVKGWTKLVLLLLSSTIAAVPAAFEFAPAEYPPAEFGLNLSVKLRYGVIGVSERFRPSLILHPRDTI
jgi:hypothetical protein